MAPKIYLIMYKMFNAGQRGLAQKSIIHDVVEWEINLVFLMR